MRLLDQHVFSGVGNIIKNEVLHRIRVHPESTVGGLPSRKLGEMIRQARDYSFDFLRMEEGLRAAQALPGAHQDPLPARWDAAELPQAPRPSRDGVRSGAIPASACTS
jgi:endonuclease-8